MYQDLALMLLVENVEEAATWYQEALGAKIQYSLPKTPPYEWVSLTLGNSELMLSQKQAAQRWYTEEVPISEKPANLIAYFYVQNADALYHDMKDKAKIIMEPTDQPSLIREFAVQDPFGFTFVFAQIAR